MKVNSAQLGYLYISKLFDRVVLPRSASFFRKLVLCSSSFQCTPWLPAGSNKTDLRNADRIALTTKLAGNLTPKRSLCAMQTVRPCKKAFDKHLMFVLQYPCKTCMVVVMQAYLPAACGNRRRETFL